MFLENDFMLMNKDEKILEFSLQPYEFGVRWKRENNTLGSGHTDLQI